MDFGDIYSKVRQIASSSGSYIKDFLKPPNNLKEYYSIGRLMISKKLVKAIFLLITVLSIFYLIAVIPEKFEEYYDNLNNNRVFTKYYNSRSLKNYNGVAKVISKKSDARYIGDIVDGVANGNGVLYNKKGTLIYDGAFINNEYTGDGTLYYDNGNVKYIGEFKSNNYNGVGRLYYSNRKLSYEGDFVAGLKSGGGTLYNNVGAEVFKGVFADDRPAIEKMLDGKSSILNNCFLENGLIYNCNNITCVVYKGLGVMVALSKEDNSLNDEAVINKIYILDNKYFLNEPKMKRDELDKKFSDLQGVKEYAGYTRVLFFEMSAVDYLRKLDEKPYQNLSQYDFNNKYSDVFEAKSYRSNDKIYVQSYNLNNLAYTYYFNYRDSKYIFYSIERLS